MSGNSTRRQDRIIAAIYCRISLSRFGDTIKVDDQEKVCRDLAAARGWEVSDAQVYKDNSVSAWKRDRKRPGWDAMLAAVERHEVNAIIVYHGDRLIRQPWDLELLLRLADDRRIQLASATGQRDLSNEDDRFIVRIEAAAACREVAATSRRLKSYYERRAAEGHVRLGGRGGRAFGFEPDGITVRQVEAEVIRDVAERILDGESTAAICRHLNERGITTTTGGQWGHVALSALMRRPRLAGLIEHNGTILGKAAWPEILDRNTWESVAAALSGKAQALGFTPSNDRKYLLSGIATCGTCTRPLALRWNTRTRLIYPCPRCGKPLKVRTNPPGHGRCLPCTGDMLVPLGEKVKGEPLFGYGCINPDCMLKVHRSMRHLDAYVEGAVVALLADERVRQAMTPNVPPALAKDLERLEQSRTAKLEAFADDDSPLAADVLRVSIGKIDARISEIRAQLSASLRSRAVDGLFGITVEEFQGLALRRRRAVVQALLRITVLASGRRGPVFDPGSVRLEPAYLD